MNKERLEKFINETLNAPYFSTLYDRDMWEDDKQELIRDIEILEILRKYIVEQNKWAYFDEATNNITTLQIISMIDLRPDNEDFEKVKEWLKNE